MRVINVREGKNPSEKFPMLRCEKDRIVMQDAMGWLDEKKATADLRKISNTVQGHRSVTPPVGLVCAT